MASTDPDTRLMQLSSKTYNAANGGERPLGNSVAVVGLEADPNAKPLDWNCMVTIMIRDYEATASMREVLEKAIGFASSQTTPLGQRGHVYFSDCLIVKSISQRFGF